MPQSTSYFEAVGQAVCKGIANGTLDRHLKGPMARDAMPRTLARGPVYGGDQENMEPRGAEEWNMDQAETPSANDLLTMVRMCLAKLPAGDREEFLSGLTDMVSSEDPQAAGDTGFPQNNMGALDRSRSGRRGAADCKLVAQDHALRAKQSANFQTRWGSLVSGVGVNMPKR